MKICLKSLCNSKDFAKKIESQKVQAKEKTKEEKIKELQNIELWKQGKNIYIRSNYQFLRLKDAEIVQTSKGVEFPVSHARLAFARIKNCADKKITWHRNGEETRLGNFRIDSIDEKGNVRAGCHNVQYPEIERFAKLAGFLQ